MTKEEKVIRILEHVKTQRDMNYDDMLYCLACMNDNEFEVFYNSYFDIK